MPESGTTLTFVSRSILISLGHKDISVCGLTLIKEYYVFVSLFFLVAQHGMDIQIVYFFLFEHSLSFVKDAVDKNGLAVLEKRFDLYT